MPGLRGAGGLPLTCLGAKVAATLALAATLVLAGGLAAQEQEGDVAWRQGRMEDARAAYRAGLGAGFHGSRG